jgi:hypothetical protein
VLVFVLMLATPVGEALASATGNHIIGTRDLAGSWPFLALFCSALAWAAGRRLGSVIALLAVVAFALGAFRMLEPHFPPPHYRGAPASGAPHAHPGDVVIDMTGSLSPGPLTGFDITFHRNLDVVRARSPAENDHPFTIFDPIVPTGDAATQAARQARGRPIYVVVPMLLGSHQAINPVPSGLPATYHLSALHRFPGIEPTLVAVYEGSAGG